jgi:multidrug efflux pump
VAAQDVRDRVARARGNLPEDIEEPIIAKQEADAQPVMWIALHSERYDTLELSRIAERQLKDVLQTVAGVSKIVIGGEKRFAIRIWLDSAPDGSAWSNSHRCGSRAETAERRTPQRTRGESGP